MGRVRKEGRAVVTVGIPVSHDAFLQRHADAKGCSKATSLRWFLGRGIGGYVRELEKVAEAEAAEVLPPRKGLPVVGPSPPEVAP
jgi:hypothetical protein